MNIFVSGNIAGLLGSFNLTTTYQDLLGVPSFTNIAIKETFGRFLPCGGLEVGLGFKWRYFESTIGWEGQIWWDQMRMNSFSTIVSSENGNNLTFTGIFWRNQVNF